MINNSQHVKKLYKNGNNLKILRYKDQLNNLIKIRKQLKR